MEIGIEDWLNEDLDFFGSDAFPHGSFKTFPLPSKLDGSWWSDSSFEDDYYNIIPHEPYFNFLFKDKLLFTIIHFHFTLPVKPYYPIKIMAQVILYAKIDAMISIIPTRGLVSSAPLPKEYDLIFLQKQLTLIFPTLSIATTILLNTAMTLFASTNTTNWTVIWAYIEVILSM